MTYDGKITIATGVNAKSRIWKNKEIFWSEMVERLKDGLKTNETIKEYLAASKEDQSHIKDVGGYVGGYLRNGRRKKENVVHRQLLTLDIDFGYADFWEDFCMQYDNAAVIHGSHKYTEDKPRYRLVIPLDREVSPDEYVAIARRIAGNLGIDYFDNSTFETVRLMFWPSCPKDVEYYVRVQDGPWLEADKVLASYIDWKDSSLWPTSAKIIDQTYEAQKKQADPETKKGIIGAFCRTYSISEAIDTFLSSYYVQTEGNRYTYLKGSTAAGMVTYEDKFAFSHHGTDPSSGKLCNAFDLVRIHKFGHMDIDASQDNPNSKSFKAMEDFCRTDENVRGTIAQETMDNAKYDFQDEVEETEEVTLDWMKELEVDAKNKYLSSATNINLIFCNDPKLKDAFKQNDFDGKRYIFKSVPWRKVPRPEPVKNVDYSGVRNYIESIYGIIGNLKIDDSMALEFEKHTFHPVRDYLSGLKWDKVRRIDTLLIDYFGADDSLYTREAMRKTMVAAVARVFNPGIKFDLVLTLVGPQGIGKSVFAKKLGRGWFSDTFMTVSGKEALEQIQGAWIIEMAELAGLRKAEVESVKHFISKQEDTFRPAYARTSETYPRQCIFIGTTNSKDFLRDPSGNRRFIPVDLDIRKALDNIFTSYFDDIIDQLWAEAVVRYREGETLFMSREAELQAREAQARHTELDDRSGLVLEYLDRLLPENWESMDIYDRRDFLEGTGKGTVQRQHVCVAEIWCECLGKEKDSMDRYKTREVNDIMRGLADWEQSISTKNFGTYGIQKYYKRL